MPWPRVWLLPKLCITWLKPKRSVCQLSRKFIKYSLKTNLKIKDILGNMNAVAEGVVTAKAVYHLAKAKKISMPIVTEVYKILFENKSKDQGYSWEYECRGRGCGYCQSCVSPG